ncbi:MAG: PilZ domain-containing protein [Deltaproteobacteria bacterium]|nr:PilZ domain-containing protein [Deltaproteobacteria bacterium]
MGFEISAEVWVGQTKLPVTKTRDVSLNGLFAVTEAEADIGQDCKVVIPLSREDENLVLRIDGRISRREEDGLGIEFLAMDPDSFYHLRQIVLYNAADTDKIETEFHRPGFK